MRRKNVQDQTDQMNPRALRRQADTSPQRQNDARGMKMQERTNNYNEQYRLKQRQQQQQNKDNYRMSSGSSSDSDYNRVGSG